MKCPVCGAAELIHDTRDLPYTYKGETTMISAVTADFCPACAESLTDMTETERVMREMQAFNKRVNAAIVDPAFIVNVRKKLWRTSGSLLQPEAMRMNTPRKSGVVAESFENDAKLRLFEREFAEMS